MMRIIILAALLVPFFSYAQNFAPADGNVQAALKARGIDLPAGVLMQPSDFVKLNINQDSGPDPYKVVRDHFAPNVYSKESTDQRIAGLNPDFARCVRNFILSAEKAGHKISIRDAARTKSQQRAAQKTAAMAAPTGNSAHEFGLAIDIDGGTIPRGGLNKKTGGDALKWAEKNAGRFGLGTVRGDGGHLEARSPFCGISSYKGKIPNLRTASKEAQPVPYPDISGLPPPVFQVETPVQSSLYEAPQIATNFDNALPGTLDLSPATYGVNAYAGNRIADIANKSSDFTLSSGEGPRGTPVPQGPARTLQPTQEKTVTFPTYYQGPIAGVTGFGVPAICWSCIQFWE